MKQHSRLINIRVLFVIAQIILYAAFLTLDFNHGDVVLSSYIKYSVIILCFCYALFSKGNDKSILFCMKTALFFTLISDLFILILDYYLYGVLTFILVQQLYGLRLSMFRHRLKLIDSRKKVLSGFILRLLSLSGATILICLALQRFGVTVNALLVISVFYFTNIFTNVVWAVAAAISDRRDKGILLFACGMSLFLLCDINVGLFNISGFINLPDQVSHMVYSISSMLMWIFYAPSQVLISLSIEESGK